MKIAVIILNYNGYKNTCECLESLFRIYSSYKNIEYIVVDNGSTDDSWKILHTSFQLKIHLVRNEDNVGYAAGNNIGIKEAIKRGAEYLCILNNDTIIEMDFLSPCIQELSDNHAIAFITPCILDYQSRKIQNTGGSVSLFKGKAHFYNHGKDFPVELSNNGKCEVIFGTCMVFHKTIIDAVGKIPEMYFLFYEETEWCIKANRKGFICKSQGASYILHKGSESVKQMVGIQEYLMERNRVVFEKRNANMIQFFAFLFINFVRCLHLSWENKVKPYKYFKFFYHGLFDKIASEYPHIWINQE